LVAAAKILVAATKNLFDVPNFVAVTRSFFSVSLHEIVSFFLCQSKYLYNLYFEITKSTNQPGIIVTQKPF